MKKSKITLPKLNIANLQTCSECGAHFDATVYRHGLNTQCTECRSTQKLLDRLILPPRTAYFAFWVYKGCPKIGLNDFTCEYHSPNDLTWINNNIDRIDLLETKSALRDIYLRNNGNTSKHKDTMMFYKKLTWDLNGDQVVSISNDITPDILKRDIFRGLKENA